MPFALQNIKEAEKIFNGLKEIPHTDMMQFYSIFSRILIAMNKKVEGIKYQDKAMAIYECLNEAEKIEHSSIHNNYAIFLAQNNQFKKAEQVHRDIIAMREIEGDDFALGKSYHNLSKNLRNQKEYQESFTYAQKAKICFKLLPPTHAWFIYCQEHYEWISKKLGVKE